MDDGREDKGSDGSPGMRGDAKPIEVGDPSSIDGDDRFAKGSADDLTVESGAGEIEGTLAIGADGKPDLDGLGLTPEQLAALQAAIELRYERPRVAAMLKANGLADDDIKAWIGALAGLDLTEDEMIGLLTEGLDKTGERPAVGTSLERRAPAQVSKSYDFKKQVTLLKHEISRWYRAENPFLRALYIVGWFWILLTPVFTHFTWWSLIVAVFIVCMKFKWVLGDGSPKHMKTLRRGYDQRKLALQRLLHIQGTWLLETPLDREVAAFQVEGLELVAAYVRDHRGDVPSKTIFANLMVMRDGHLEVVARSDRMRPVPQRYTREQCGLVWDTITDGRAKKTGDLYTDFPATNPGKAYKSVLVLPVNLSGRVLGAVSIDSEASFHFDRHFEDLVTALAPYVQLLAITLVDGYAKSAAAGGEENDNAASDQ